MSRRGLYNQLPVIDTGAGFEQETQDYIARVEADGGTVADKPYTNSWIKALKDEGVWAGLRFSYGADYGYKLTSGAVSTLYGIEPQMRVCDLTESTASEQPARGTNIINTRPAIVFTEASNHRMRASLPSTLNTGSATFYVVASKNADSDDIAHLFGFTSTSTSDDPDSRLSVTWWNPDLMEICVGDGTTTSVVGFNATEVNFTNTRIFRVVMRDAGSVVYGGLYTRTSGTEKATSFASGQSVSRLIVGGTGADSGYAARSFGGYICEIHGFSGVHSTTTQDLITDYLYARYWEDPALWEDVVSGGSNTAYTPVLGTNPSALAPTGGSVDDVNNTFTYNPNPNFTISQHEYSLNGGTSWATPAGNVITVGDTAVAVGDLKVRVKALNGNPAGLMLSNTVAFTASSNGGLVAKPVPNPTSLTWEYGVVPTDSQKVSNTLTLKNRNFRSNTGAVQLDLRQISNGSTIVIEDCCFYGGSIAIWSEYRRHRITIRNCFFFNTSYTDSTDWGNWAYTCSNPYKVTFENNYVEGRGVQLEFTSPAAGAEGEGFTIRYNKFKNIHGDPNQIIQGGNAFAIRGNDANVAGILFEWNEIKNEEGLTHVEDNVNLFRVGGTAASKMTLRHNFVRGAYSKDVNGDYSGGGFICEMNVDPAHLSNPDDPNSWDTNYEVHDNIIVHVKNYCIGVASGNNINIYNNKCIVAGMHTKASTYGTYFNSWSSGIWSSFYYNGVGGRNVNIYNNEIGVRNTGNTQTTSDDFHQEIGVSDGSANAYNNTLWENLGKYPTLADEDAAEAEWNAKLSANNKVLGPVQATVTTGITYTENFNGSTAFDGLSHQYSTAHGFTLVPSPSNGQDKVGRWELRDTDPENSNGTRCEVLFPTTSQRENGWYRWEGWFPSNGDYVDESQEDVISQWHQGSGSGTPSIQLYTRYGNFQLIVKDYSSGSTVTSTYTIGPKTPDMWHTLVFHIIHRTDGAGLVEIWYNGTKTHTISGPNMNPAFGLPRWKIGIYKSDWNGTLTTSTTKRVWYINNVKQGNSSASYESMK